MIGETSAGREATASEGKNNWARWAVLGTVCVLIIGFFVWSAKSGLKELLNSQPGDSYYNLLVQGFRAGQLNVKREAPPELAKLANPYDNRADMAYLYIPGSPVNDMSYYKGKLYLYFGITPALVLFWPYVALTGHYLLHKEAVVIFCSLGFLAGVGLLWSLWRRYFVEVSFGVVVAGALALGLGTGIPVLLEECDFYEVPIGCGYALTMVSLVGIWKAMHEPERRCWWLAGASMAYGLAVGSRPNLLFGGVILLVPVFSAWREGRRVWPVLMGAVAPMVVIGLGLMLYNFLRFNNPLEFGWHYQLPSERDEQHFSLRYLWFDFRLYFLEAARWSGRFPFVRDFAVPPLPAGHVGVEAHCGVLSDIPVMWLALAAPLAWWGRTAETGSILRRFVVTLALLFGICVLTLCLFWAVSLRYEMDFLPTLGLLAVIGIFGLERALAGRLVWRRAVRWCWGVLLVISVAFNLCASYERSAEFHHNLGFVLSRQGRLDEAIAQCQKTLQLQPGDVWAHNTLGYAFFQKGRIDEAIAQFQKALELQPKYEEAYINLGSALFQKGRVDEAIAQYQKALELQPNDVEAVNELGFILFRIGRVDEAVTQLKRAVELLPDSAAVHNNLGLALRQKGQVDEAIAHFKRAAELQPDDATAQNTLGSTLFQMGQVDEAIAHFQKALELQPSHPEAHYNLGLALRQKGRVDEAIAQFKWAVEFRPADATVHYNLGSALLQKGQVDEGIAHFQKALELRPNYPEACYNLGNALVQKGRMHEAITCFQKALELQPNNPNIYNKFAWLLANCPDASLRNGPKAIQLAQQADRLVGGQSPVILRTLAAAYAGNTQFPEAVSAVQRALQLATAQNDAGLVNDLKAQLGCYQAGSPFRGAPLTNAPTPVPQTTLPEVGK